LEPVVNKTAASVNGALTQQFDEEELLAFFFGLFRSLTSGSAARQVDADYRLVVVGTVRQFDAFDTGRQLQIGNVQQIADMKIGGIHFDEFRQILWQATHFDVRNRVIDSAAFEAHSDAFFLIQEVQRNSHRNRVRFIDALKVCMQQYRF